MITVEYVLLLSEPSRVSTNAQCSGHCTSYTLLSALMQYLLLNLPISHRSRIKRAYILLVLMVVLLTESTFLYLNCALFIALCSDYFFIAVKTLYTVTGAGGS